VYGLVRSPASNRNGIDIARIIAEHPRKDFFKIILVTGCSEAIISSVSKQFEMRGLQLLGTFQKPVDVKALCELLKAVTP
jgi:hypothetical protein